MFVKSMDDSHAISFGPLQENREVTVSERESTTSRHETEIVRDIPLTKVQRTMFPMRLKGKISLTKDDVIIMVLSILDGMNILKSRKTAKSRVYGSVLDQTREAQHDNFKCILGSR